MNSWFQTHRSKNSLHRFKSRINSTQLDSSDRRLSDASSRCQFALSEVQTHACQCKKAPCDRRRNSGSTHPHMIANTLSKLQPWFVRWAALSVSWTDSGCVAIRFSRPGGNFDSVTNMSMVKFVYQVQHREYFELAPRARGVRLPILPKHRDWPRSLPR